ncbi:MAG TPA: rhodanese-like domain-containing protein [Solirubrobacteraceae bacterium]|jgi:rhodanese-related sulfurtransferase
MSETLRSMIAAARGTVTEVPPAEAYEAQQSDDVHLIVDVREPHEFDETHVRNAVNVPRGVLELRADADAPSADPTLSGGRSERIILYCTKSPGARSLLAAQTLQNMGYESVEVLGGGLEAWTEAGLPVDRSAP